jgi:single-strand DNA-binding protein
MANFNKVILIGRFTRDPETRSFASGGKVASFSLAVNERKKSASGQWEDAPIFLDCKAFNRGTWTTADKIAEWFRKGSQILIEGKLSQESWDDKTTGAKRSKIVVIVESFESLDARQKQGDQQGGPRPVQNDAGDPYGNPAGGEDPGIPF